MSLLSSFLEAHLVPLLESQFIAHEPELKEAFANEVSVAATQIVNWANDKLQNKHTTTGV